MQSQALQFGSIAQLVQSICLTSRGSGVRIPLLPQTIKPLYEWLFCLVRSLNGGVVVQHLGRRPINKLVTPRRGTHGGGECGETPCPDVGVFRCFASLQSVYTPLRGAMSRAGVSARFINNGRSPQNCIERGCVSAKPSNAILRDDELICAM